MNLVLQNALQQNALQNENTNYEGMAHIFDSKEALLLKEEIEKRIEARIAAIRDQEDLEATLHHDFTILIHNDLFGRTIGDFCDEVLK